MTQHRLDTALLGQYLSLLGPAGLRDSVSMFSQVGPEYLQELAAVVQARDESATRRQAHKLKGGCRSLGLQLLAGEFAWLEQDEWGWSEVEARQAAWSGLLEQDLALLHAWLAEQPPSR